MLPYAFIDTSAGSFRASANGASDIGFLWQMNIFGGPALTRAEFASFVPQTFSSFHLLVTTPIGTYNPTSPINPSANRWMVSPTVNFSYTPDQGWSWIETYVSGRFFSDNDNYRVNGAQTLSQKPLLRLEEHLSRNVTDALWLSVDAFYNVGGETSIDGFGQDNMANTLKSAPAWACACGAAPTLASTTNAWSPSPSESRTRRPCASRSDNCGEARPTGFTRLRFWTSIAPRRKHANRGRRHDCSREPAERLQHRAEGKLPHDLPARAQDHDHDHDRHGGDAIDHGAPE